jgi:hypothetical protein
MICVMGQMIVMMGLMKMKIFAETFLVTNYLNSNAGILNAYPTSLCAMVKMIVAMELMKTT